MMELLIDMSKSEINVTKRSGNKEPLAVEKWQAQVSKVCQGIADVSQSMIEIKAQPHFYDGISTREIDEITLRAIVNLIDVESNPEVGHTNYQYVAGKQTGQEITVYLDNFQTTLIIHYEKET